MSEVKPGQVWADNDKRHRGRTVRVESLDGDYADCVVLTDIGHVLARETVTEPPANARPTRIALSRFRPNSTGYRLIQDV